MADVDVEKLSPPESQEAFDNVLLVTSTTGFISPAPASAHHAAAAAVSNGRYPRTAALAVYTDTELPGEEVVAAQPAVAVRPGKRAAVAVAADTGNATVATAVPLHLRNGPATVRSVLPRRQRWKQELSGSAAPDSGDAAAAAGLASSEGNTGVLPSAQASSTAVATALNRFNSTDDRSLHGFTRLARMQSQPASMSRPSSLALTKRDSVQQIGQVLSEAEAEAKAAVTFAPSAAAAAAVHHGAEQAREYAGARTGQGGVPLQRVFSSSLFGEDSLSDIFDAEEGPVRAVQGSQEDAPVDPSGATVVDNDHDILFGAEAAAPIETEPAGPGRTEEGEPTILPAALDGPFAVPLEPPLSAMPLPPHALTWNFNGLGRVPSWSSMPTDISVAVSPAASTAAMAPASMQDAAAAAAMATSAEAHHNLFEASGSQLWNPTLEDEADAQVMDDSNSDGEDDTHGSPIRWNARQQYAGDGAAGRGEGSSHGPAAAGASPAGLVSRRGRGRGGRPRAGPKAVTGDEAAAGDSAARRDLTAIPFNELHLRPAPADAEIEDFGYPTWDNFSLASYLRYLDRRKRGEAWRPHEACLPLFAGALEGRPLALHYIFP